MANTTACTHEIEDWFRAEYLRKKHPGMKITAGERKLVWGGVFKYDGLIFRGGELQAIYCLSCSEYKTVTGKGGSGKFNKIQADMLKMVGTESPLKVLVFTGRSMYLKVIAEQESGRLPKDVRCELASLPPKLLAIVQKVRADSVEEVTPAK